MDLQDPSSHPGTGHSMVRAADLAITLVLLFGLTYVALALGPSRPTGGEMAILVGFVLLVASVSGHLAARFGLPRLTGFLVVGILAGPSVGRLVTMVFPAAPVAGILSAEALGSLAVIDQFALALIALLAGGELKLKVLRPQARPILLTTLAVTGVVWLALTAVVVALRPVLPFLAGAPWGVTLGVALLLGIWAANSSPDLTVAVMEETGAKGALAEVILGITIVKDVLVIVLFTLTLALVRPLVEPGAGGFDAHVLVDLGREVGGSLVLGGILGWVFSLYLGDDEKEPRPPIATFLFAYVLVVVADALHLELLLTGVAAGFVIENLSPAGDRMIRGIEAVSVVIFAFFFAVAGARLDLGAVGEFWFAALVFFSARALFTYVGTRWGTAWADAGPAIRERTWRGLISQGGVTLGLALVIQSSFPEVGSGVVALAMAVIIGNILVGPVLLKHALASGDDAGG